MQRTKTKPTSLADWQKNRATLTMAEVQQVLGIGRTLAYELARRGELPTIRLGGRVVIPVEALRRMLGEVD